MDGLVGGLEGGKGFERGDRRGGPDVGEIQVRGKRMEGARESYLGGGPKIWNDNTGC